jgi:hypothetical protein
MSLLEEKLNALQEERTEAIAWSRRGRICGRDRAGKDRLDEVEAGIRHTEVRLEAPVETRKIEIMTKSLFESDVDQYRTLAADLQKTDPEGRPLASWTTFAPHVNGPRKNTCGQGKYNNVTGRQSRPMPKKWRFR